jgi:nucleotide-binding universal stress UspA family protein
MSAGEEKMASGKIVFATDYSRASELALEYASRLAMSGNSRLLIVHVSERELYPVGEECCEEAEPSQRELDRLRRVAPPDAGVPYEHHLLYGEPGSAEITKPASVIAEFAKQRDADLIVVGTHGRTGLSHLLMGSVAESLIRHSDCPVMTIRQPKSAKATSAKVAVD